MRKFKMALLLVFLTTSMQTIAQNNVCFAYDEVGNRVKREIVIRRGIKAASRSSAKSEFYYDALGNRTIKISPNPSGIITINILHMKSTDEGFIEIYSINGMQVFRKIVSSPETIVDISQQPLGIYTLRVTVNGIPTIWKIAKK